MTTITYSAPAKIIFSGEHAVVYGKPGLVCAIDKRVTVHLQSATSTTHIDTIFQKIDERVKGFLQKEKESFVERGYSYTISSDIPLGRGMGSSAALAASFSAALLELFTGKEWSVPQINQCAYEVEKLFHHNPSGVDVSASVFGGLIWFRKEFEFLKSISSLTINIPRHFLKSLYLIDTGKPLETTAQMVGLVGIRYNKHPLKIENILSQIERVTKRFVLSVIKEDEELFKNAIQENEVLLEQLGIVSRKTQKLLQNLNALGVGKVTGAGGKSQDSGFILFYADNEQSFLEYCKENNLSVMKLSPTYKGITKEII